MSKFTKGELAKMSGSAMRSPSEIVTGATYSSDAVNNAYNAALAYVTTVLVGGEIE